MRCCMRRVFVSALALVIGMTVSVAAQQGSAASPLQGRWVVTAAEHNGKPLDAIKGGVMTIAGEAFEVRTATGNMLKGTLRLDPSTRPAQMDLLHADGAKWEAIYDVSGEIFRINYVEAGGKDPRPSAFATSKKTEESLVVMRRQDK